MSEQDSRKNPETSTAIVIGSPKRVAADTLAREMAGKIVLDMVGTEGMSKDKLNMAYRTEYALRRNELEHIAGHEEPYAEKQIQSGEINHQEPD
ncbi:hypothetical protein RAAC3_TM7C00001G0504 [Candidatus Saccharibacteria bacterium RAAC3_TM7_1]|nr:hypothetical protein RAAC3_TM7C00001G0504 [Candidatus Saccharibacteria bacterium RAAC3_TM7_1]HCZ28632.1 hypothetical protein [Candidatus Saccharibacteria bacterium]